MKLFNRHKHQWKAIRTEQMSESSYIRSHWWGPVTLIYWKCIACGSNDITEREGSWTDADLGITHE